MERVNGIEPSSSGWKPEVIAVIRHPHGLDLSKKSGKVKAKMMVLSAEKGGKAEKIRRYEA